MYYERIKSKAEHNNNIMLVRIQFVTYFIYGYGDRYSPFTYEICMFLHI